jgi:hypothetical protein
MKIRLLIAAAVLAMPPVTIVTASPASAGPCDIPAWGGSQPACMNCVRHLGNPAVPWTCNGNVGPEGGPIVNHPSPITECNVYQLPSDRAICSDNVLSGHAPSNIPNQ